MDLTLIRQLLAEWLWKSFCSQASEHSIPGIFWMC